MVGTLKPYLWQLYSIEIFVLGMWRHTTPPSALLPWHEPSYPLHHSKMFSLQKLTKVTWSWRDSLTSKVWGLIAQHLGNTSLTFLEYQHFTRVYIMSQNDSNSVAYALSSQSPNFKSEVILNYHVTWCHQK